MLFSTQAEVNKISRKNETKSSIGIAIAPLAISLIEKRMMDAFSMLQFEVEGVPKDLDGAKN